MDKVSKRRDKGGQGKASGCVCYVYVCCPQVATELAQVMYNKRQRRLASLSPAPAQSLTTRSNTSLSAIYVSDMSAASLHSDTDSGDFCGPMPLSPPQLQAHPNTERQNMSPTKAVKDAAGVVNSPLEEGEIPQGVTKWPSKRRYVFGKRSALFPDDRD